MEKVNPAHIYCWHALYVKSRAEKKAQLDLQAQGIETYLPVQRKLRQWSDRKKWVEMPLIAGYLFVKICRKEYDQVLQSNNVVSYVRFEGKAAIVPDDQIDYLKLMLSQQDNEVEVTHEKLKRGQIIEVVAGPLIGLKGKLQKIKGKNKVAIELIQLGCSAMVEIEVQNIISIKT
jgi:transcription antitermination factor NusG